MHQDVIPEDVLRGKIMATKILVKKQTKAVKQVETEILEIAAAAIEEDDSESLKAVAGALREFYICIENALGFIGHNLDGSVPTEGNVSGMLLDRMAVPFDKVRSAVIDKVLKEDLLPYLQFRMDLEKDPGIGLDRERIAPLVKNLKTVSAASRQQLTDFFE